MSGDEKGVAAEQLVAMKMAMKMVRGMMIISLLTVS
jgi:hypothetical protein